VRDNIASAGPSPYRETQGGHLIESMVRVELGSERRKNRGARRRVCPAIASRVPSLPANGDSVRSPVVASLEGRLNQI
jgi:hypothetical protein